MNYSTLILDFDGTLADTRESILQSMKFVAERFKIRNVDEQLVKGLIGLPLKSTFEQALSLDESLIRDATLIYRQHYNEIAIESISLFENVETTLRYLHQKGVNLTIASSKGQEALIKILKKQGIYELFAFIGGEEDAKNKKPSPDLVNHIMNRHNYPPHECLVVGDTVFDIEMGQRAHVNTCGVTYGNNTREELARQRPTYIIDDFKSLTGLLDF
ncbi:MAG: HAD family hydrolase [Roseivirga sp.]|nr:HAD family hydrolase [Roseivirga sp.]